MARKRRGSSRRAKSFGGPLINKRIMSSILKLALRSVPFIIVAVLAGIAFKAALSLLLYSDYFRVKTIRVTGEKLDSRLGPVAVDLSSKKGDNIFGVNLKGYESDIRHRYPELKGVVVRRVLPDTLEVAYKIRRPFCQVDSGYFYLVSDDMVVFPKPLVTAEPDLPIITGVDISKDFLGPGRPSHSKALKRAISLLKEVNEGDFSKRHRAVRINIYDPQSPSIYIEDGTRIEVGEYSFKERQKVLGKVLDDLESRNKKAKIIDLRFGDDDVVVIPR